MKCRAWILSVLLLGQIGCAQTQTRGQAPDDPERADPDLKIIKMIGDVTDVVSPAPKPISGVALVYNLEGTGGGIQPGPFKDMLDKQLRKQQVRDVSELLSSPNCTMVTVNVMIPTGIRKGDRLDVEVELPPGSRATSLEGGILFDCSLQDYDLSKNAKGDDRLTMGRILGKARGPLLVGLNETDEEKRFRRGRIWEGAVVMTDAPFYLYLKNDQRFASVANMVANRINSAFPNDAQKQQHVLQTKRFLVLDEVTSGINEKYHGTNTLARGEAAQAVGNRGELIGVKVPYEYRLNPARYLLVVRLIPLRESPDAMSKYRKRLGEMLLDPQETVRAALRLEALGKEGIPALKKGLNSDCTLVRFASAEALAYLGSTAGVEELGALAQKHETLREGCLTALGGLSESASQGKLAKLLETPVAEIRMGAFRNLLSLTDGDKRFKSPINGDLLNDAFWLHQVAPNSEPLVHLATSRRAEIVVFGNTPALTPPFRLGVGTRFGLFAEPGDTRCTVTHYKVNAGKQSTKQCSLQIADIVQTIAALGGNYPDAFDLLRLAEREKCLNCVMRIDALPTATPIELLAACGSNASKFKDDPARQQEVLAAQEDLGMVVRSPVTTPKR